jgi:hypothetical protein
MIELSDVGMISKVSPLNNLISTLEFAGYTVEVPLTTTVTSSIQ